ncbi:MAG: CopG family transcriptional regulator [Lentisphaerae bacterium RIFOXYC12_FULL_60_16]|nr:MAG: CopG family transcriptional regulator [Lentisphaerae bacterium RIFOXYC12_FULL_60_16]OGV76477.1 MAG: CopG family transcriptional regulator [Lentisphaerae bacterium RIFOXYB12_FULL_60_10]
MDTRLGFVGIIIENRTQSATGVNRILSEHGNIIVARTGIPHAKGNTNIITLVVDTDTDTLGVLTGKLGALPGVSVKSALAKLSTHHEEPHT